MKVTVVSQYANEDVIEKLQKLGFSLVDQNPEIVIPVGGDGTVLFSERAYPGVPKLILKKSRICRKCDNRFQDRKAALEKLKHGEYWVKEKIKLETEFEGQRLLALNDIQVHSKLPTHAVRFSLEADGHRINEVISDGVIVATPFGSTAYYASAGGEDFSEGIGVVLNNPFIPRNGNFTIPEAGHVRVVMQRETAWLVRDNDDEQMLTLREGDSVTIRKAEEVARFVQIE